LAISKLPSNNAKDDFIIGILLVRCMEYKNKESLYCLSIIFFNVLSHRAIVAN
jgi:hypothetical protein